MKKIITLGLALITLMVLTTVCEGAYSSEQYEKAIYAVSEAGILAGDERGFRPDDTLSRAEAAKVISTMVLGSDAKQLKGSDDKFVDVKPLDWYAGYVEYMVKTGAIGGVGGGKFNPDGKISTLAYAKMLLVSLGFDPKTNGLSGAEWSLNPQRLASEVGIFDINEVISNDTLTRRDAALYTYNAMLYMENASK